MQLTAVQNPGLYNAAMFRVGFCLIPIQQSTVIYAATLQETPHRRLQTLGAASDAFAQALSSVSSSSQALSQAFAQAVSQAQAQGNSTAIAQAQAAAQAVAQGTAAAKADASAQAAGGAESMVRMIDVLLSRRQ